MVRGYDLKTKAEPSQAEPSKAKCRANNIQANSQKDSFFFLLFSFPDTHFGVAALFLIFILNKHFLLFNLSNFS